MKKMPLSLPASRVLATALVVALPVALWSARVGAAPKRAAKSPLRLASLPSDKARAAKTKASAPLPRFVPMATIKKLQLERAKLQKQSRTNPFPVMQPVLWNGQPLKKPMHDLVNAPSFDVPASIRAKNQKDKQSADLTRIAQVFPRPIAPARPIRPAPVRPYPVAAPVTPNWVRYPLEFQLAGIGIGTRAVDKDRFNRIDRYGLFALHGNPTAVVRASDVAGGAGDAGGDAIGGGDTAAAATGGSNVTLPQTPPELSSLFPPTQPGGGLPAWALAITVSLDNNHVEWLYNRGTYSMGFVVDRLGFVDAVIVAGTSSDITQTQLEDPVHTVKLGDDLRKVLFRYGYPDDVVPLAADPSAGANNATGAPGGGADSNAAFRTYDLRYEQSYNVVFTIRNNRVVRVYIFGDPDFFIPLRRGQLRGGY